MEDQTKPQKSKLAQKAEQVQDAADKLSKAYRTLFILWNLLYIVAYSVFIVITMSRKNAEITWLPYLLIAFTAAYFVAFVAMICMGRSNAKLGSAVKDYKSSFKIMKLCLKTLVHRNSLCFRGSFQCLDLPHAIRILLDQNLKFRLQFFVFAFQSV